MSAGTSRSLKSRAGCKTCKIRRVKCGEEKPHCVRCTSTGRTCEYSDTNNARALSLLDQRLSLSPNTVWRERRAFAYYFQCAAQYVGGELDVDFWRTVVPQVCRTEPAVWDAIIAMSVLIENPEHSQQQQRRRPQDALAWYARSVSAVRQRLERGGLDLLVGLISCTLFICIESLQGGIEAAVRLYGQGVRLILALRAQIAGRGVSGSAINAASLLEETIVPIFTRMGMLALATSTAPAGGLRQDIKGPTAFLSSLKAARETIVALANEAQILQTACNDYRQRESSFWRLSPELIDRQKILSASLQSWHKAFTDLAGRKRDILSLSPSSMVSTSALLLAYYEMLVVSLATCVSPLQTATDAYIPRFQTIVDQCRIALDASMRPDGTQPPLSLDVGVSLPLWFTSLRCREPQIRRAALALLRRAPLVQGFYQCIPAASLGERIMALEERHGKSMRLPGNNDNNDNNDRPDPLIPEEARFGPLDVFWLRDGCPPGPNEELVNWDRSRDQSFLRYSRNKHDPASGTWQTVYECVCLDFEV
ncbi:hypothetical protein ASPZODRAFT_468409 [Penicilliopsis zonata CBS 506.65]|uniref:Zn(2)-C6 fungal-type domain-containing protein n=1 Tax=Penicilliopsis zonata CBS 506.65 TaxID=1073090 RepID=A0A1L9SX67_9EURO|nr:hypothetical protein ASPZODRAFT_468409 [Penicilliopsis zonata CBS 506.65]OJJ51798.1 hypothetical protein ASPZODRAFT_468409 [Penicilliopsis zonata CBS 506.65]